MKKSMRAFVRYPLLGCLALFLTACGSSGSQTLLRAPELSTSATTVGYPDVEYLLEDSAAITAAREKFVSETPDEETDARPPSEHALQLNSRRNSIVNGADRYLSTGALVTDTVNTNPATSHHAVVSCGDGVDQTKANCVFPLDSLRDRVTFHLGRTHARDNNVGFVGFSADRQPVMDYRDVRMSQVRTTGTDTKENATPGEDPVENDYEYVGYDGMLRYSMFFVGVYKFFDDGTGDDRQLEHLRFENASLGRIYDADTTNTGIDNPDVDLTGTGVMAGVETQDGTLNSHLVQGDVGITYTADTSQIEISITNVQRLGSGTAWYTGNTWTETVNESQFTRSGLNGSFYGTGDNYEVGGVFYETFTCQSNQCSIVGAFGSTMSESN